MGYSCVVNNKLFHRTTVEKYDVIVVGGGLAGVMAAIAASREGLNVLLLEKYGFLGGMATCALVSPFMPFQEKGSDRLVSKGLFEELLNRLDELGGLGPTTIYRSRAFSAEILKLVLDRMVKENNVNVLFHSQLVDVKFEDKMVTELLVASRVGIERFTADLFIDATGNADLTAFTGIDYMMGREEDGLCQWSAPDF